MMELLLLIKHLSSLLNWHEHCLCQESLSLRLTPFIYVFPPSLRIIVWFSYTRRGCRRRLLGWSLKTWHGWSLRIWIPFGLEPCGKREDLLVMKWQRFWSHLLFLNLSLDFDLLIFCKLCWRFVILGCIYFPNDGLMINTFDDYLWYYGDVALYLW